MQKKHSKCGHYPIINTFWHEWGVNGGYNVSDYYSGDKMKTPISIKNFDFPKWIVKLSTEAKLHITKVGKPSDNYRRR